MMNFFLARLLFVSSLFLAEGFSPLIQRQSIVASRIGILPPLKASLAIDLAGEDEVSAAYLLAKARECAFSDAASPREARKYLDRILEIESGCVTGKLAGHDLCDNVLEVAEVVSNLREKADATAEGGSASLR